MRAWALAALDLVFPAICPVCQDSLGPGRRDPLCATCWDGIERVMPPWCDRCGLPLGGFDRPSRSSWSLCGACTLEPPAFDWARTASVYAGPVREAVQALKFSGKAALARPLAALVVEQCAAVLPADVAAVVPVPLARARERERGYNQAALIAERIARAHGVPVRARWLSRVRATAAQTELAAAERRANVRGAFRASEAVRGLHVVVVDDVFTTGATVSECAGALRAAGAAEVGVLAVARVL